MAVMKNVLAALLVLAMTPGASAMQAPKTVKAEYSILFLGLRLARSTMTSTVSGDDFALDGTFASSGLASLFDSTKGTTTIRGKLGAAAVEPSSYLLNYTSGGKAKKTEIRFAKGDVVSTVNVPALRADTDPKYVAVPAGGLRAAVDPITATIFRADGKAEVCNRTLKVYDGEIRVDLRLSPAGTKPFRAKGFEGEAVRCKAQFVPVSGYRKGRKALDFLRAKGRIEIAFAELAMPGVWAPVSASVATEVGTVYITATSVTAN